MFLASNYNAWNTVDINTWLESPDWKRVGMEGTVFQPDRHGYFLVPALHRGPEVSAALLFLMMESFKAHI